MIDSGPDVESIDAADHLVHRPEAELGHQLADLLGDEPEERLHVLGLSGEAPPQPRVLGGHAHGAGVEVADPHHDTAHHHQGSGGKAVLLGPHQGGDDHVSTRLHLPVRLDHDPVAQLVQDEHLLARALYTPPVTSRKWAVLEAGGPTRKGGSRPRYNS